LARAAARANTATPSQGYERPARAPVYSAPAPAPVRRAGREEALPSRAPSRRKTRKPAEITAKQFRNAVAIVVLAGALALVYIFLAAQEAVVQKEINDLEYQIAQIEEEIVGAQVGVEQGQNIQLVRQKARDELGMSDPALEQNIYVNEIVVPEEGVAQMIKNAAYGEG
jgi:cell division protein FtsL